MVIEKNYFQPGDLVTLRQDIPNKPIMMVVRKEMNIFNNKSNVSLRGIKVRWFTDNGFLQEMIVSTKDLISIK